MSSTPPTRTQTERADQTRARILDAAVREFSENGLAGARTEQIAEAAGVNKALLYYYFEGKDALYAAALEDVAQRVVASSMAAMKADRTAGEQVVHFALNHFDRIHSQQAFQRMMQQEMMRLHRGEENALTPIVERVFGRMMMRLRDLLNEGKRSGELIEADEWQIMYAALGANVFYFLSAPVVGLMLEESSGAERDGVAAQGGGRVPGAGDFYRPQARGGSGGAGAGCNADAGERTEFKRFEVKAQVNARNRVFMILGLLTVGSLIWYLVTVRPTGDLQLIGTVDANEVVVSAQDPGAHPDADGEGRRQREGRAVDRGDRERRSGSRAEGGRGQLQRARSGS